MNSSDTYSEEELVLLLRQKGREGFNYLYRHYAPCLFGIIKRIVEDEQTAQDVLENVLVNIWKNIDHRDAGTGRIYTWMVNIARNHAIEKLRSRVEVIMQPGIPAGEGSVVQESGVETWPTANVVGKGKMRGILKPAYGTIVELAYFKGYTLEQISKAVGDPLETVKIRMREAIQQLREIYNN